MYGTWTGLPINGTTQYIKSEFFETEDSRKLRGNHAMRILNAKNVTLDTVRVFFAPEVAHCWEGALKAEISPGLQVLHCNF